MIDYTNIDFTTINDVFNTLKQDNNLSYDIIAYNYKLLRDALEKQYTNDCEFIKDYIKVSKYLDDRFNLLIKIYVND